MARRAGRCVTYGVDVVEIGAAFAAATGNDDENEDDNADEDDAAAIAVAVLAGGDFKHLATLLNVVAQILR